MLSVANVSDLDLHAGLSAPSVYAESFTETPQLSKRAVDRITSFEVGRVSASVLFAWLSDLARALLVVDARAASEHDASHIDSAVCMDVERLPRDLRAYADVLVRMTAAMHASSAPADARITVVCYHLSGDEAHASAALRAARAFAALHPRVSNVVTLTGGLLAFAQAYPLAVSSHPLFVAGRVFPTQITPTMLVADAVVARDAVASGTARTLRIGFVLSVGSEAAPMGDATGPGALSTRYVAMPECRDDGDDDGVDGDERDAALAALLTAALDHVAVSHMQGARILVASTHGNNRAALVAAAHLCVHRGVPLADALAWLAYCRMSARLCRHHMRVLERAVESLSRTRRYPAELLRLVGGSALGDTAEGRVTPRAD